MKSFSMMLLVCCAIATSAGAEPWPPYFEPTLLEQIDGERNGESVQIPRGYVLHREDMERISVLGADLNTCQEHLGECEQREVDAAAAPGFWNSIPGTVLKYGLTFAAGVGTAVAIAFAVGEAG